MYDASIKQPAWSDLTWLATSMFEQLSDKNSVHDDEQDNSDDTVKVSDSDITVAPV